MSSIQPREPFHLRLRKRRRQMRRWLEANGLTIVLVSAMMVIAWMIAAR